MQINHQKLEKSHALCLQEAEQRRSHSHDQSTQAMTEVALALSMAFFSLLLLALISMGVPPSASEPRSMMESKHTPEFILSTSAAKSSATSDDQKNQEEAKSQFIFYYSDAFYDRNMTLTEAKLLDPSRKLVIAMPEDTNVAKALWLQQEFAPFDVSLTLMNTEWLSAFQASRE